MVAIVMVAMVTMDIERCRYMLRILHYEIILHMNTLSHHMFTQNAILA